MKKNEVTIVVPVYNVEPYLERCLNSILNQTYYDMNIIIVDDGSTDNSPIICDDFAKKDSRIKVIHQSNMGLSAARNTGIKAANSTYIMFIDSDDYIEKDMVEYLLTKAKQYDSDIACCGFSNIYENGNFEKITIPKNDIIYDRKTALDIHMFSGYIDVVAWNKLYKLKLFDDILYPVGKLYEDMMTTYLLINKSKIISLHPDSKYLYCKRSSSIGGNSFSEKTLMLAKASDDVLNFVLKAFPNLENIKVANIQWNLVVFNKMILSNSVNVDFLKKIKIMIHENFITILKCKFINKTRKIQLILLYVSPKLYKKIYIKYIEKNR